MSDTEMAKWKGRSYCHCADQTVGRGLRASIDKSRATFSRK